MPQRTVREMIERDRLVGAGPEMTVREAAGLMAEGRCGSVLVLEEGRLLGIFTERDLLNRVVGAGRDPEGTRLAEVMTRGPDTIGADEPIIEAIRKMDEFSYRYLPVLDGGAVIGVISTRHLPFGEVIAMAPEIERRHRLAERML
jgi:CBS domain-containing protein